jgi:hypothetical protein
MITHVLVNRRERIDDNAGSNISISANATNCRLTETTLLEHVSSRVAGVNHGEPTTAFNL